MNKYKVCTKCKKRKPIDKFPKYKGVLKIDGSRSILTRSDCKICCYNATKRWFSKNPGYKKLYRKRNPEKVKQENLIGSIRVKLWCLKNKERLRRIKREYKKRFKEHLSEINKKSSRKVREQLFDSYVITKITRGSSLTRKEVKKHPMLIELKREIIRTRRLCRKSKS
jgi:hypothetical protein